MIIHHSLVDASSIICKQRFLHDVPFWPLPEPLLVVSTTNAFQCTYMYACTMRVDCSFYSYNKPSRKWYLYADQPGAPVVTKAKGNGNVFYKGVYILYLYSLHLHILILQPVVPKQETKNWFFSYHSMWYNARWIMRLMPSGFVEKRCKYCSHQALTAVGCVIHTKTTMVVILGAKLQYRGNKLHQRKVSQNLDMTLNQKRHFSCDRRTFSITKANVHWRLENVNGAFA